MHPRMHLACTLHITWEYHFWYTWTILFSKIYHMLGLSGTLSYAVFVYLCICIFVYALLTHGNVIFDILELSSFQKYTTWVFLALCHMLYLCICVFVYLCICIFVFALLTHGNIIFDILEQSSFLKHTTCWVFLALCHMLYLCIVCLCICVFVFLLMKLLIALKKILFLLPLFQIRCFISYHYFSIT